MLKKSKFWIVTLLFSALVIWIEEYQIPKIIIQTKGSFTEYFRKPPNELKIALSQNSEKITIQTPDGLLLKAVLVSPNDSVTSNGLVIFLHGIRSAKSAYYTKAEELAQNGISTLLIDQRAHGESEGKYCTFGFYEKKDVSLFLDSLYQKQHISTKTVVGVWGQSLGGAVALQSLANDNRIDFGIIESTFSDYRRIVNDYTQSKFSWIPHFIITHWVNRAGEIARFNPDSLHISQICTQIQQPILLAHGTADKRISPNYAKINFNSLKSTRKNFHLVMGAGHLNLWKIGGEAYDSLTLNFLKNQL